MCRSEAPRSTRRVSRSCIVAAIGYAPSPTAVVIRSSRAQGNSVLVQITTPDAKFVPLFGTRGLTRGRRYGIFGERQGVVGVLTKNGSVLLYLRMGRLPARAEMPGP